MVEFLDGRNFKKKISVLCVIYCNILKEKKSDVKSNKKLFILKDFFFFWKRKRQEREEREEREKREKRELRKMGRRSSMGGRSGNFFLFAHCG